MAAALNASPTDLRPETGSRMKTKLRSAVTRKPSCGMGAITSAFPARRAYIEKTSLQLGHRVKVPGVGGAHAEA